MSIHDTWIRVSRSRGRDRATAMLSVASWAVLDQIWAIAADEGEQEGVGVDGDTSQATPDVLVDARHLEAEELLLEMPRTATLEDVQGWLDEIIQAGLIRHEGDLVRVPKLAAYNERRFAERARQRARRRKPNATVGSANTSASERGVRQQATDRGPASANSTELPLAVAEDRTGQDRTGGTECSPTPSAPDDSPAQPKRPKKPKRLHPDTATIRGALLAMIESRNRGWPPERVAGLERASPGWDQDIDRLLRLGPADEPNAPVAADTLLAVIAWLKAEAPGSGGFAWADQVQSGAALRRHLRRIQDAMDRSRRAPAHANGQQLGRDGPARAEDFERLLAEQCDESGRWTPPSFDDD